MVYSSKIMKMRSFGDLIFKNPQYFGFEPVTDLEQYDSDSKYDYIELIVHDHDKGKGEYIRIRAKIDNVKDEFAGFVSIEIMKPAARIMQDWEVIEEVF